MKSISDRFFTLALLSSCYLPSLLVSGCVFTAPKHQKTGIWDFPRKIWTKSGGCSCGTYNPTTSDPKTWLLYINSFYVTGYPDNRRVCTGTIIASNLVAVSHTCLTVKDDDYDDRKIQIYETWRPPPKLRSGDPSVVTPDKILLATNLDRSKGSVYHVKDIILSTRYSHSVWASETFKIEDDVALLVTQDNLFEKGHNSVCMPSSSFLDANKHEKLEDLLHSRLGFYYDSTAELAKTPTGGAEVKNKLEKLVILRASDCNKKAGITEKSADTTLCVRYLGNSSPGYSLGGPLLTYSHGKEASFLVGMAETIWIRALDNNTGSWYSFAYFTNILALVRYIDMNAYQTKRCRAKDLKLSYKVKINSVDVYPWETGSFARKEVLDCTCGIRNDPQNKSGLLTPRIIGGVEAEPYEFPWIVYLDLKFNNEWSSCGASIINDRIILTANEAPGDIAIITLKQPVEFSKLKKPGGQKDFRPICLHPNSKDNPPKGGEMAIVAGWGKTGKATSSNELRKVDVPIIHRSQCQDQFYWVTDNHLCAGYSNGSYKDSSQGDSGGPLMVPDKSHYSKWGGQFYEVGMVSYGNDVFDTGAEDLSVYTNVQKKNTWILLTTIPREKEPGGVSGLDSMSHYV